MSDSLWSPIKVDEKIVRTLQSTTDNAQHTQSCTNGLMVFIYVGSFKISDSLNEISKMKKQAKEH